MRTAPSAVALPNVPSTRPAPIKGVVSDLEAGIGVIGFEGVEVRTYELENLVGAVPRVRGASLTGVGLERVLEQGGRAPKAGLDALKNRYGGPDRIDELAREAAARRQGRLAATRAEAEVVPVQAVSEEALRMLDAYINRTDELHPFSTELLAQSFSSVAGGMPPVGARVPIPKTGAVSLPELSLASESPARVAAEEAVESQLRSAEASRRAAEQVAQGMGFYEARGTLIDQRH